MEMGLMKRVITGWDSMNAAILKLGSIGVQQHRKVGQRRDPLLVDADGVSLSVRVGRAHCRYRAVNVSVSCRWRARV
jgi:hypothetical protein